MDIIKVFVVCFLFCFGISNSNSITTCTISQHQNEVEEQIIQQQQQQGLPGKRGPKGDKGDCRYHNNDEKLQRMMEKLTNLASRLIVTEGEMATSQQKITELEKQNSKIEDILEDFTNKSMEVQNLQFKENAETLEEKIMELEKQNSNLKENLEVQRNRTLELESQNSKLEENLEVQRNRTLELESQNSKLEENLEVQRNRTLDLENQNSKLEENLEVQRNRTLELENQNSKLEESLEVERNRTLELESEKLKLEEPSYQLRLTSRVGTFEEVQQMCIEMGGRLLQRALTTIGGKNYLNEIAELFNIDNSYFIGIHDRTVEGRWDFVDFNGSTSDIVIAWGDDQPDNYQGYNNGEDCGAVNALRSGLTLNDVPCSLRGYYLYYGCCEIEM